MHKLNRRQIMRSAVLGAAALTQAPSMLPEARSERSRDGIVRSPFVVARDGTRLFVQDWGSGRPVIFLSAWTF